jgi:hypothetical protein
MLLLALLSCSILLYRITNGIYADYFTTACRTGKSGMGGISLLLIPRSEGITTKQMQCQGMWASGTTYVTYENVKVPVENLLGVENEGFKPISKYSYGEMTTNIEFRDCSTELCNDVSNISHFSDTFIHMCPPLHLLTPPVTNFNHG